MHNLDLINKIVEEDLYVVNSTGYNMRFGKIYNHIHIRDLFAYSKELQNMLNIAMYKKIIEKFGNDFDYITFAPMGGMGLIDLKNLFPDTSYIFIRNYEKVDGNKNEILGIKDKLNGNKFLIIEDILGSGNSVIKLVNIIKKYIENPQIKVLAVTANSDVWVSNFAKENIEGELLLDILELTKCVMDNKKTDALGIELIKKQMYKNFDKDKCDKVFIY